MPVTRPFSELEGKKYNKLTIVGDLMFLKGTRKRRILGQCDCGVTKDYFLYDVQKCKVKSCGCMPEDNFICCICKTPKHKDEFPKRSTRKRGVGHKCKDCFAEYRKKRYWDNHEAELEKYTRSRTKPENLLQRKGYYEKNKEGYFNRHLKYKADPTKKEHKTKVRKEWEKKAADKIKQRIKAYSQREEVIQRKRKNHQERKKVDVQYVIKRRLRCRLRNVIKSLQNNKYKKMSTMELLGCDIDFFQSHIESKFTEGMNWSLVLNGKIHMDHVKPCAKFDLTQIEEQKKCFHYSNIQPLWEIDNLKKNAKYED